MAGKARLLHEGEPLLFERGGNSVIGGGQEETRGVHDEACVLELGTRMESGKEDSASASI